METKPSNAPLALETPQEAPAIAGKRQGNRLAMPFFGLSIASFAGSGIVYYFYRKDHWKEEETFSSLNNLSVKGSNANGLLSENKAQHQESQKRLTISQILLGLGAAFLATDIVFYF